MECIVIAGIMKNATMKGLIAFDFGSFVKSKRAVAQIIFRQSLPHSIRKVFSLFAGAPFGKTFQTKYSYGWVWATSCKDATPYSQLRNAE